jgi:hypothetical protein
MTRNVGAAPHGLTATGWRLSGGVLDVLTSTVVDSVDWSFASDAEVGSV